MTWTSEVIPLLLGVSLAAAPGQAAAADAPARPAPAVPQKAEAKPAAASEEGSGEGPFVHLKAPLFDDRFAGYPIATVDGDAVELRDLTQALASAHEGRSGEAAGKAGKTDFAATLDRLIDARLIVADARDIGLDALPETVAAVAEFRTNALTEALREHVTRDLKPDPAEVERLYRDAVREWKLTSVLFPAQADAIQASARIQGGASIDEVAKQAVAGGKASGGDPGDFVPAAKLLPQIAEAVGKLEAGAVTAPLQVAGGWTLVRLDAVRYPEVPKARSEAEQRSVSARKAAALKNYYAGLVKKWVKVDEALLRSIDYDAPKPGIEAYEKDRRVVARIQGEKPITVAGLTAELEKQYFHGIQEAVGKRKVNRQKLILIDALTSRIVVPKEARRLGLDGTEAYRRKVADYQNSILFGTYVEKAILPNVKVEEEELKRHYEGHKAEYGYPAFYKLDGLGFRDVKAAQAAVEKLRAGTDLKWLKANTEGQLRGDEQAVHLDGSTVSARSLPEGLAKALAGAKKGDVRLFAEESGHYVVQVLDEVPASTQPYPEVRGAIVRQVAGEKVGQLIRDTAAKLRGAHQVRVFISRMGS